MSISLGPTLQGAPRWAEPVARAGYATKGVIYTLLGALSCMAALGLGGKTSGSRGAVSTIGQQPFGSVLLWLVCAGMSCYVVWKLTQAIADPEDRGAGWTALGQRLFLACSGVGYSFLAFFAGKAALGAPGGGDDGSTQKAISAQLLQAPFGRWALALVGVAVIGVGLRQFMRAYQAGFMDRTRTMSAAQRKGLRVSGRIGLSARGVVFGLIGAFFVQAAVTADPDKAEGLSGVLDELARTSYGAALLGSVAAGLCVFGLFSLARGYFFAIKQR